MNGPLAGELSLHDGVTREALDPALAAALGASQAEAWPRPSPPDAGGAAMARAVFFTLDASGVTYEADLSTSRPLAAAGLGRADALRALAMVGRALAHLHRRGIVHGDVRPELVWTDASNAAALLVPSRASSPGATLRARMHPGGAALTAVGFAAPEVVAAYEVTPASDVFGLAAIVYATLTGYPPLGQVNLAGSPASPDGDLARAVDAALNQVPASRPSMEALSAALDRAAETATSTPTVGGAPYRGAGARISSAAEADHVRRQASDVSPVLVLVLIGGGFCAFVGAVLLVVAGWDVVGAWGRVLLLVGLAAAAWGAGELAGKYKLDTGVTVGRGLAGLFATVGVAYAFYLLDAPGRLALLMALTLGALGGGALAERRGAPLGGAVLLALGSQLVWTVGAQLSDMVNPHGGAGAVSAVAGAVSVVTLALTLWRGSALFATLAALDLAVFFAAFGAYLRTGAVMGPSMYALAVAVAYGAIALVFTARKQDGPATPLALGATLSSGLSALLGLVVMSDHWETHGVVGAAWPFAVTAVAFAASRAPGPLGMFGAMTFAALLGLSPTAEAMIRDEQGFMALALGVGAATLCAALFVPSLRREDDARVEAVLLGLFGVMAAPCLRLLQSLDHRGEGWPADGDGVRWVTMAAVSAGLVALSYAATSRVSRGRYRMLEIAALAQLYGFLTLQTLILPQALGPAELALASSAALLTLGWVTRRAAVLVLSAVALTVNVWIQYFVRLEHVFPLSVRLVGFGVGLLVGGVLYEQQVRHRLSALRDWH